jgi:hypothetical protein
MRRGRYRARHLRIVLIFLGVIFPFGLAHPDTGRAAQQLRLPQELRGDLLNALYAEATERSRQDAPGAHLFGISITVWPFGTYANTSPAFEVGLRFRKAGAVSSYIWRNTERHLAFTRDTHVAIGAETCTCSPALWADANEFNGLISFGYNRVSERFPPHETSAYELNTNAMTSKCKWRVWFFHDGNNIGSFVLEKSGPRGE